MFLVDEKDLAKVRNQLLPICTAQMAHPVLCYRSLVFPFPPAHKTHSLVSMAT